MHRDEKLFTEPPRHVNVGVHTTDIGTVFAGGFGL
jgi:hypothetical protein